MPVSVDTRVRVDRFWNIIATDFPSKGCCFCKIQVDVGFGGGKKEGGLTKDKRIPTKKKSK